MIDLYYLHRVDGNVPLEDSWGAMASLVEAGLVRALGLSEVSIADLAKAYAVHPVAAVQSELSLWTRDPLDEVMPWCADHGAVFVPFSLLGRGFLTGTITSGGFDPRDFRSSNPRFTDEAIETNQEIVAVVRRVAERYGATPAQVALAWTLAQGDHVLPIPGTKRLRYLDENVATAALVLSEDDLAALDVAPSSSAPRY